MQRTFQSMSEIASGKPVEIVNYHYARFMLGSKDGARSFEENIKSNATKLKEDLGVDITATVTGNDETIVLVDGIGSLYDAKQDELVAMIRLADELRPKEQSASPSMPVLTRASDMMSPATAKLPAKPSAMPVKIAASPVKTPAPLATSPASPAKTPATPVKTMAAKPIKPAVKMPVARQAPAPAPRDDPAETFLKDELSTKSLVPRKDLITDLAKKFNMNASQADGFITEFIKKNDGVSEENELVFMRS